MTRRTAIHLAAVAVGLCLLAAFWIRSVRDSYRIGAADAARPAYAAGLSVGATEGFLKANAGHPVQCLHVASYPHQGYSVVWCKEWMR